tara:strand:+ start:12033 stop:12833 length:801 start_codon:yes stop_codon:yes gene_type:complete
MKKRVFKSNSNEKFTILIAIVVRYNEPLNSLSWINATSAKSITLFNKGTPFAEREFQRKLGKKAFQVMQPNIAFESFSYLEALLRPEIRRKICNARRVLFTQAVPPGNRFAEAAIWAKQRSGKGRQRKQTERKIDAERCFSSFGPVYPFEFCLHCGVSGLMVDAPAQKLRSTLVCPEEDHKTFLSRTKFAPGATFITTGKQACAIPTETVRGMQRELINSWRMGKPKLAISPSNSKATWRLEYVFERSWSRIMTNCTVDKRTMPCT